MPVNKGRSPRKPPPSSNGSADPSKLPSWFAWRRKYTLAELPQPQKNFIGYTPNVIVEFFARVLDGDEFKILMFVIRWTYGGKKRPTFITVNAPALGKAIGRSTDVARGRLKRLHELKVLYVGGARAPGGGGDAGFAIGLSRELVDAIEHDFPEDDFREDLSHRMKTARDHRSKKAKLAANTKREKDREKANEARRRRLSREHQ